MKKLTLFAAIAFIAVSTTSCRKDYTCTCTSSSNGFSYTSNIKAKSTKKDAKAWCDAAQSESGSGTTCSVK